MCESRRSDQFYQVCGSVSGAPAREAGEAGANPAHLTTARGDEVVESALCRREVSRCKSDHERQFMSRCRLAAMAAGLHPASTGVQVPPPRPLPGSSTVERPPVKRRDVGANPTPAANFVGETASDVTCPTCRHCSEHHRGGRPFSRSFVCEACALNGRSSSGQGPEDRKDNDMIAVALVIAWFAAVGLVLIARGDYRQRRPIR